MPDRRKHRGKPPEDERLFAETQHVALRTAVAELAWLLTRGYAPVSALKLVGDRYSLTARQRLAVRRSSCSDQSLQRRLRSQLPLHGDSQHSIGIDGYNLLITLESALAGGMILIGRDGCYRDLAGIHGTYRKVVETAPAITTIASCLAAARAVRVDWYLDRPVSNSGRLKTFMAELLGIGEESQLRGDVTWNIELVDSPDAVLAKHSGPVVSADSVVLDRCVSWINLAAEIIDTCITGAWTVDLRSDS